MENSKNNKIILTISSVALLISIAALLLTVFSKNKTVAPQAVNNAVSFSNDSAISGNVAYVNLDTLLLQYKYSIKLNVDLLT
ncbi:MAG: hypothetical protein QM212_09400 [Bacteroidota bacterium]|nr:hypothetical protein [Bacteroidota bacterium]